MENKKDKDFEFEIIDEKEIEFAKRGRKPEINEEIVAKLKKAPIGKRFGLPFEEFQMKEEIKSSKEKQKISNEKARLNGVIRKHLKAAGFAQFQINWTTQIKPTVKITK